MCKTAHQPDSLYAAYLCDAKSEAWIEPRFSVGIVCGADKFAVWNTCENFTAVYLLKEMASFFSCRILTSVFTYVAMIVMVDGMGIKQDMICKIVVSAISLVLNYICSKLFIFKKKESSK